MDIKIWRFYKQFYKGFYQNLFLGVFLSIVQSLFVLPISFLVRAVFDQAIPNQNFILLCQFCTLILFLYILDGTVTLWTKQLFLKITKIAIQKIRDEIVLRLYRLPRSTYSKTDRLKLHARIVQDTLRIDVMSNALMAQFFPAFFIVIGICGVLIYLNWILFIYMLISLPCLVLLSHIFGKKIRKKVSDYHAYFEVFSKRIHTLLNAMDLTRIRAVEKIEFECQQKIHDHLREKSKDQAWLRAAYQVLHKTTALSTGMVILVLGGRFVISGQMSLGDLIAFIAVVGLLRNNLQTAFHVIPQIIEGNVSLKRLFELFQIQIELPYQGPEKIDFQGNIVFDSVDFRYVNKQVLHQISFALSAGETIVFTGPNGAGKTTLILLLLGFYKPEHGSILIENQVISLLDMNHFRKQIGVLQQDPVIIPGTLRENLIYGMPHIKHELLENMLEFCLCGFINKLPDGLDTVIERKDTTLSAGELQKLALCRALIGSPKLVILDEPTNHLDEESISRIMKNIQTLYPKPSVILISHHKAAIQIADCVYTLREGRLS